MKKLLFLQVISLFLFSCQGKKTDEIIKNETNSIQSGSNFQMYEMSELALLMEQMYAYNLQLKTRILSNDSLGVFPENFEKIHTAIMTDPSENDIFFQEQAAEYLKAQKAIYSNPKDAKVQFNKMVESCLACHAKKCGGPIPRIKKLFIN